MKRLIMCIGLALTLATATLAQTKETVTDYYYPADTMMVSYIYSNDTIFNGSRVVTRMTMPDSTSCDCQVITISELMGDEFVSNHIQFTDSTVTVGMYFERNTLFNPMPNRLGYFYNIEVLRLPPADAIAEWDATYSIDDELYAKKLKMKSERVLLPLTIDGMPTEIPTLCVTAEVYDRFGNHFPGSDFVEFWGLGKGLILKYNAQGKLLLYSSSISNPPTTIEQLEGLR